MAEINIDKKENTAWPWILGGLVLLAVLLVVVFSDRGVRDTVVAEAPGLVTDTVDHAAVGTTPDTPAEVNAYIAYTEDRRARQEAELTHEFTADGIRRLAAALESATTRDEVGRAEVAEYVRLMRSRADSLQVEPMSDQHARHAREAFTTAANLIGGVQRRQYPDMSSEAQQVNQAATAINPNVPLLQQSAEVQEFFDRSANALRSMAQHDGDAGATNRY